MFPSAFPPAMAAQRGSAVMVALFVIVIMALLAAAMGRFLVDSGEKNTVEVRGVRALMAAQSGLEIALYRLYPNNSWTAQQCAASTTTTFTLPGLVNCQATVTCTKVAVIYNTVVSNSYRLTSVGSCGSADLNSANPDFAVSRTVVAEAYDGATP